MSENTIQTLQDTLFAELEGVRAGRVSVAHANAVLEEASKTVKGIEKTLTESEEE